MSKCKRSWIVLILLGVGCLGPAAAVEKTLVFQQGAGGYGGVRDTWISAADWDTPPQHTVNYGINEQLVLTRDGNDNPLLRFDLGAIPANSAVVSAKLSLFNLTNSACDQPGTLPRNIDLFRVLRGWDEGNQVGSRINAVGKHGATGDSAFDYFPGAGTDVAWSARGMAASKDYAAQKESTTAVVNAGWYDWDVTSLVRRQVRGEQPNYGMVLRDVTGYQDANCDWRTFVSSQSSTAAARRPKLTVLYNPDVPFANAGPDQENLDWTGAPITLDGSGSHDRPGGNDAALRYSWRVARAAYGSQLNGAVLTAAKTTTFTPDVPGEWDIELTVTNSVQESAKDSLHVRVLRLRAAHPRIYLTPTKLAQLKARATPDNPRWVLLFEQAQDPQNMHAGALVSAVTGQPSYCTGAVATALSLVADANDWSEKAGDLAVVYDWCYASLTAAQRKTFVSYFNAWGDANLHGDGPGWGNYWPRYSYSMLLIGLATRGDNPRAVEWLNEYRRARFAKYDLPALARIAQGGGWPEGTIYDGVANYTRIKAIEAWRTAGGENLFLATPWFRERAGHFLLHHQPGLADNWGHFFHPYNSTGDAERNRGAMLNYERIMALILIERFPGLDLYQQLQSYLDAPPTNESWGFLAHDEFLWFNPLQTSKAPGLLTHYAPPLGTVFMRSGWPDGAADTDPRATYLTFQCGDHFSYHQHYDQNSFTLFKYGDLAVDSGVYSGEGLSAHDINYYVRTIAHNTLVVRNPAEDFSSARPDATSNDGGQRSLYPASRAPDTVDYLAQHAVHYDTGDIARFADTPRYTYVLGDATKAYNNPVYNQTMDTMLTGNVAKVTRFQREFLYLRPAVGVAEAADYVVIFDRVAVAAAAFSGANTKLLFHTLGQPMVADGTPKVVSAGETLYSGASRARAVSGNGKLFMQVLLPAKANVRKVGGRGAKAFWVFDSNFDWHWDINEPQPRPISDFENVPYGEWRLEVEPADTALQHNFLTVLYPTAATTMTMPATALVSAGTAMQGAHIADPQLNRVALFSAPSDGSAPAGTIAYDYAPSALTLNLLFDLKPGAAYRLATQSLAGRRQVSLVPDPAGTLRADAQGVVQFVLPK